MPLFVLALALSLLSLSARTEPTSLAAQTGIEVGDDEVIGMCLLLSVAATSPLGGKADFGIAQVGNPKADRVVIAFFESEDDEKTDELLFALSRAVMASTYDEVRGCPPLVDVRSRVLAVVVDRHRGLVHAGRPDRLRDAKLPATPEQTALVVRSMLEGDVGKALAWHARPLPRSYASPKGGMLVHTFETKASISWPLDYRPSACPDAWCPVLPHPPKK
jgi:hypothetical protein